MRSIKLVMIHEEGHRIMKVIEVGFHDSFISIHDYQVSIHCNQIKSISCVRARCNSNQWPNHQIRFRFSKRRYVKQLIAHPASILN